MDDVLSRGATGRLLAQISQRSRAYQRHGTVVEQKDISLRNISDAGNRQRDVTRLRRAAEDEECAGQRLDFGSDAATGVGLAIAARDAFPRFPGSGL
ncbi:hypothetical protein [Bradyrhizobium sp.]|uniref:hypothetical protein n=1 Tax=Bradyrhizobium sp. TaxID=376 RepID=UPI001E106C4F|nr:hypothetical protein [Bradyrhizobium sp.]MBV8700493.1 hypothetical protein [Bradyrhizobium sp.]MBV8921150.1 hypothetical protein [Bradyrhizobium sp.]MBV9985886.1 hypothetical protein [Bradyrhizobium sp.]